MLAWTDKQLEAFVEESNRIEGIRNIRRGEIAAHEEFLHLSVVAPKDLEEFVSVVQPGARIRDQVGMDVRVGNHLPPLGGPDIPKRLAGILGQGHAPWVTHLEYENLHPFMDGNGRSGRVLWAWQMINHHVWPGLSLGFLHAFYYQTLQNR